MSYEDRFDDQLQALDQVRAVQRRLLPLHQRQRLDDIVRCFSGMRLADEIDRIVALGFDQWRREGFPQHINTTAVPVDSMRRLMFESEDR